MYYPTRRCTSSSSTSFFMCVSSRCLLPQYQFHCKIKKRIVVSFSFSHCFSASDSTCTCNANLHVNTSAAIHLARALHFQASNARCTHACRVCRDSALFACFVCESELQFVFGFFRHKRISIQRAQGQTKRNRSEPIIY